MMYICFGHFLFDSYTISLCFRKGTLESEVTLDIVELDKSKTLQEFAKICNLNIKSANDGEDWIRALCNNRDPFNRQDTSNDQQFYR